MSDYNTTPATEDEMAKVREIFERALNAIVSATALSKEVEQLRNEVRAIHTDLEAYRARNIELDNELATVRDQRDQALRDKQAAIEELNRVQASFNLERSTTDSLRQDHEALRAQHEILKHDHDNVQLENMSLADEVKDLKAKLEKVKAVFGIQPRDVETGKWQSPTIVEDQPQVEQPKTGTDPYWR